MLRFFCGREETMNCLLGIDIGSSAVKVGIFRENGELLTVNSNPYATTDLRHGFKEQNPSAWWGAVAKGIQELVGGKTDISVLAIGITGFVSSLTFIDGEARPLRPALGFQDQRAFREVEALNDRIGRSQLADCLGIDLPPAPTWPLPRLMWMRKHEPETLDQCRYLLQAKDYVNLQLTGEVASDPSSNRGLVDFSTDRPATDVLKMLDLPDLLPPLRAPETIIGKVTKQAALATGLKPGVPVTIGWNDLNACVLGSGIVECGETFDVAGTSEHIGIVTTSNSSPKQLICAPYLPGRRLLYGVISSGGGSLEWFRRFSGKSMDELLEGVDTISDGLLFLPYLEGERAPIWDPLASGVMLGLRSTSSQRNAVRAILEGVAFALRQNLDLIYRCNPSRPKEIIASGGPSRIKLWNQIKANVFNTDVVTLKNPHAGIQGAATLAAVAAGLYPDLTSAAEALTRTADTVSPDPRSREPTEKMYRVYAEAYPALRDVICHLDAQTTPDVSEAIMRGTKRSVIFGAGKIARAFMAHLLTLSGYEIVFVEKNRELVDLLRKRGKYHVEIMGAPEKSITIQNFTVYHTDEMTAIAAAVASADVVFVSIGGPNLPQIAPLLAAGLQAREVELNIILGENFFQPGQWLRQLISECLPATKLEWFANKVGIVETMILRSSIEPTPEMKAQDPLSLKAQDMWEIPADKEAFKGEIPPISGLSPKEGFQGSLIRKLFTYNCLNAVIAYIGLLKGYTLLSDAANDQEIVELARTAYRETSEALCERYGFGREDQTQFAEDAIAKYQRREIVDPIERNTRDPLRKLARNDRLVGPACLAADYGVKPVALSRAIAAAFLYNNPSDPASVKLQQIVQFKGIRAALGDVSGIETDGTLADLIVNSYQELNNAAYART